MYKIEPVEIDKTLLHELDHGIWQFPSVHIMIGKIASGKSTFIYNLINKIWYPAFQERIILFSPTGKNDPIINGLIENDQIFCHFEEFNMQILDRVIETIAEDDDENNRYLIVFDDCMSQIPQTISIQGRLFNKYLCNFRHIPTEGKITLLFSIQKFSSLNNVLRANSHYIYLLGKSSEKELKFYSEELNAIAGGSSDKFMELYHEAKEGNKYNFAMLDFKKLRFLKNFDTLLYSENNEDNENNENNNEDNNLEEIKE